MLPLQTIEEIAVRKEFLYGLLIMVLSGCYVQEKITRPLPAKTVDELAAREAILKVIGVHYLNDAKGFITIVIFEDVATSQRLRWTFRQGESLPQLQLEDESHTLWAVGIQAKFRKRDDGSIVAQTIIK
jgi:hypothetical protein